MKNIVSLFAATALCGAALAAQNDALVSFSTKGPDKYADGAPVLDGECYALCWSKDFSKFAIKSDATADGGEVVLKAPVAKKGRCPKIVFEIDADELSTKYKGGEWAVYLLDTRTFAADGTARVSRGATKVNTAGRVASASTFAGSTTVASIVGTAASTTQVAAGVTLPETRVKGIRVEGGYVYITVHGAPFLGYTLASGDTPDKIGDASDASAMPTAEEEVTIVTPAKAGGSFFKVGNK